MRLFIAIDLGKQVRDQVERQLPRLRALAPEAKWVRPDALHTTLAFLGHLPEERVVRIKEAMRVAVAQSSPLLLRAHGVGAFGSSKRPRVLWTGLIGQAEQLISVQKSLEGELVKIGYQPEKREYRPHLTLARARDPRGDGGLARCVAQFSDLDFGEAQIDRLVLFKSDLSPQGARYTALEEAPLKGMR